MEPSPKENIFNIPNFLTLLRVAIALSLVYFIFAGYGVAFIVTLFVIGQITDFLDGQIARRFNMTTEFGRKFDMTADRVLLGLAAISIGLKFSFDGIFSQWQIIQIILIFSRELLSIPFVVLGFVRGASFPKVRFVGKFTTVLQAFAFPSIILSSFFSFFFFAPYLALITCAVGLISGGQYIKDILSSVLKKQVSQ
jgi:CDP-diacylglycerol--glycerol-3-phosphate 3-phosphatidyltransferase